VLTFVIKPILYWYIERKLLTVFMQKLQFKSLLELQTKLSTEKKCFDYLVKVRWSGKPICVYCNHDKVCVVKDKDFKCSKCNRRFTIKTGTIMEGSKLTLKKWLMAIYFVTNDKKGVSSYQLSDNIGVTQKTGWFILQRLKHLIR
jgi:transposase-like protein